MRPATAVRPTQRSHSRSPSKTLSTPNKKPSKPASSPPAAFSGRSPAQRAPAASPLSPASRARLLHALHLSHNGRLLLCVEKEEQREARREALLSATQDASERWRLEGSFGVERGEAAERLTALSAEYEREMALKMHELGMIGGWDGSAAYRGEWEEKKQLSTKKKPTPSAARARSRVG